MERVAAFVKALLHVATAATAPSTTLALLVIVQQVCRALLVWF
jgi:hypothetical protein